MAAGGAGAASGGVGEVGEVLETVVGGEIECTGGTGFLRGEPADPSEGQRRKGAAPACFEQSAGALAANENTSS
jgi:hypothetical protein